MNTIRACIEGLRNFGLTELGFNAFGLFKVCSGNQRYAFSLNYGFCVAQHGRVLKQINTTK